ncbi:histidine--tRNA ligase [Sphingobacteriaceae bacterium]|nr:histidine--tRNA ligase [Sphingobacteriaceae bacterium]
MKPSIPKGTRDFGPVEMQKRQYIFSILRKNFQLFGYEPIETPTMENISTLTGKYGEEGDQLIFKILNSRIHEHKNKELLKQEFDLSLESPRNSEALTERALRYDLTVPFARYVVMNQGKLVFPFKRYQIQPVWRADKPQRGRYREFYQCDADVIGSNSLINELDLIALIEKSFHELQIPVLVKFNNRKILTALAEVINEPSKIIDITVAIDKLDKIGKEGVNKELAEKEISAAAIATLQPLLDFKGNNLEKVEVLRKLVGSNEAGKKGIEEIEFLLKNIPQGQANIELDITLARGLNYYTGTIFEVKANAGTFTPSILGGGRYDDLTGIFGLPNMSGVGISFGVDRIYDVMEELNVFPESISKSSSTTLLFTHFDEESQNHCIHLAAELRKNEISCEIYPDLTKKLSKQLDYANKKNVPFVCTVGSNEIEKGAYAIKHMTTGNKKELNITDMIHYIKTELHDIHN